MANARLREEAMREPIFPQAHFKVGFGYAYTMLVPPHFIASFNQQPSLLFTWSSPSWKHATTCHLIIFVRNIIVLVSD